jgi:dTMP kinase
LNGASSRAGLFITFEGGEGTGKTTQIKKLREWIEKDLGRKVLVTWEPGGSPLGEKLRSILLSPETGAISYRAEALLYAAARAEHVDKVIRPAMAAGTMVLCDRYWDASKAYQGHGRGLGFAAIDWINHWATENLFPDRVFVFDIEAAKGLERARQRNQGAMDRLEQEKIQFHEDIRRAYLHMAKLDPARYRVVSSEDSIEEIEKRLRKEIKELLEKA